MSEAQAKAPKKETVITTVTMNDARVVDFPGKRKILKESFQKEDGTIVTRIDFINGSTVNFVVPQELIAQLAAHGAAQKLGDAAAGAETIDDAFEAVNELAIRLSRGEWSAARESSGVSGASVLVRALMELYPSKTADQLREFLSTKTQAQKLALRNSDKVRPIVARIEAEKGKKAGEAIDTDGLLNELG